MAIGPALNGADQTPTAIAQSHWAEKADSWIHWADPVAAMAEKFNRPFLELLNLQAGHGLLDLASGAGEPAFTGKSITGPTGMVVATDFVPGMLTGLKRRDRGNSLRLAAADMQRLPFASESFDRVSCRFGIMFVPDPIKAIKDCFRVLKPGGGCGFMVWGPEEHQTLFSVLSGAVSEVLDRGMDPLYHAIFRFGTSGELGGMLEQAGFEVVREYEDEAASSVPLDKPFWHAQLDMSFGHVLSGVSAERRQAINDAIGKKFRAMAPAGENSVRLHHHRRTVVGWKPE